MTSTRSESIGRDNFDESDIFSEDFRQNWFERIASWTTRDPFYIEMAGAPAVIVARHAHVRELLTDNQRFTTTVPKIEGYEAFDMYNGVPDILHIQGADHRRMRQFYQSAMSPRFVADYSDTIREVVENLIDAVEGRPEFDAVSDFAGFLIAEILFGRILDLQPETFALFKRMKEQITTVHAEGGHTAAYLETFELTVAEINRVIEQRSAEPTGDFIGAMIKAKQEDGSVGHDEVVGSVFATGVGSVLPTSASATAMLWARCRYRDQFDQLKDEPELAASAVEESLRLHPGGVFILPRFALEDTEIAGTRIGRGMPVMPCVAAANVDPDIYPDPFAFDVRRNPRAIFTFGRGMHNCAGAQLARKILETTLVSVMRKMPDLDLVDPDFRPVYSGQPGELTMTTMPVRPR